MRRATIHEYDKLADKLSNLVAAMNFQFMELCVKAEPVALLNVRPEVEGEKMKLEDCARIAKSDDYSFMLIPIYDEDLTAIAQSILRVHPEFKVEGEKMTVDMVDGDGNPIQQEVKFLNVTMPEVNDDRYDVLKQGVDALYEAAKNQMEAANVQAKKKFAELAFTEEKEDLDKLDDELKKLNDQWNGQRDHLHDAKLKEIEDAHNEWLTKKNERNQRKQEQEAARGDGVIHSMRMDSDNDK